MTTPVYILGIDLSKARLDCATLPDGQSLQFANSPAGFAAIIELLAGQRAQGWEVLAVVEATGGYERALVAALCAAGLPIAVVNPKRVRACAKALGIRAKTDRLDARVIARYGLMVRPRPSETRDRDRLELAELLAYRDQLTGEIVARWRTTAASIAAGGTSPRAGPRCVGCCTWRWWRACGAMPGCARCTTA